MRTLAKKLLVLSSLAVVVIYFAQIFPRMQKGLDFPDFYAAARMMRDGRICVHSNSRAFWNELRRNQSKKLC